MTAKEKLQRERDELLAMCRLLLAGVKDYSNDLGFPCTYGTTMLNARSLIERCLERDHERGKK